MTRSTAAVFVFGAALLLTSLSPFEAAAQDDYPGAIEITEPGQGPATELPPPQGRPPANGTRVGRKAAEKYMSPRKPATSTASGFTGGDAHYLALHLGTYVSDTSYRWGEKDSVENVGKLNFGLTYRVGEWVNSMDMAIRIDVSQYTLDEGRATKLSFLPVVMFPDANSKFPLYFGVGAGAGIFMNQINKESAISIDYQLIAGARFFDVFENTGFFIEAGLKNHLFLVSDGQFNGTFAAAGTVFTF